MEKMFKRSVLGAAVALAAVAGSANAAVELVGENVVLYGQAAGNLQLSTVDGGDNSLTATIESRIGLRGRVAFDDLGPDFIWQVEGGNADNDGFDADAPWTHVNNGQLGARDTYIGFDFDGVGSIKVGRQLQAAYNYVDWPHTNPGLGNVFDFNQGDLGTSYNDRANDTIRFDSATFSGFNFQLTASGMASDTGEAILSAAGSYSNDLLSVHAGYWTQDEYTDGGNAAGGDNYAIVGGSLFLGDATLTAGYKMMENRAGDEQNALSLTAAYVWAGQWVTKVGYASTSDTDGRDDSDTAITARVGYQLPSAFLYVDVRDYSMASYDDKDVRSESDTTNFLLGMEYYW